MYTLLIARAVERSNRRGRHPARRRDLVVEEYEPGLLILSSRLLEQLTPGDFGVAKHVAHKLAGFVSRLRTGRRRRAVTAVVGRARFEQRQSITLEEIAEDEQDQQTAQTEAAHAAATHPHAAETRPLTAPIFNVLTAAAVLKLHDALLPAGVPTT